VGGAHPRVWAEQSTAADALQRPLRCRFQARLSAAMRRENQELKTDAPSGHGLAAALDMRFTGGKGGPPATVVMGKIAFEFPIRRLADDRRSP
jgi:hypothetical protein